MSITMNELETNLKSLNDWRYELYLMIKKNIDEIAKKYQIEVKESDRNLLHIFLETVPIIACNKEKYLIKKKDRLQTTKDVLRALLFVDESSFALNKKETIDFLTSVFLFPLVKELKLKKELRIHRNQKGKEWREILYKLAEDEWKENKSLDGNKTLALKSGFEKLPNKETYRTDFDLKFASIYRKFIKRLTY